jgi:salicylate hydroxylase
VIHRRDLLAGLLGACRQREEIALDTSSGVKMIAQQGDSVIVTCENGATHDGCALIGADGLWSPTRQAVIADGAPRIAGHYVYRGVVPTEQVVDKSRIDTMTIWGGPPAHGAVPPAGRAVMNNVATICSRRIRRGEANPGAPDELEEIFAHAPGVRGNLRDVSRERNWVLYDREPATNWTQGRVTLLGDAAHPTLQYLAQGAQMAIEDGVVLAEKVAAAGDDYHRAFLAYQRERMNRTARVVLSSRFFGEYIHVDGGARALRNELARGRDPDNPWEVDWLYKGIEINDRL